jgi:hypothetical protein
MSTRRGATLTLIGVLAAVPLSDFILNHLPNPTSLLAGSVGGLSHPSGLKFKIQYGDFIEERQTQCGRNICPTERVPVKRLKIQSLNEKPVGVQNAVVNDNEECSANPLAKIADALKAEGRDPGLLAKVPARATLSLTMKYGDVADVPLFGCEPIRVRILTDQGESAYELN